MSYTRGAEHPRAQDENEVVRRARELRARGKTYGQIAMLLKVPYFTVRDWVTGRTRVDA